MDASGRLAVVLRRVVRPDGDVRVGVVQGGLYWQKYAVVPPAGCKGADDGAVDDDLDFRDGDVIGPDRVQPLAATDYLTVEQTGGGDDWRVDIGRRIRR